MKYKNESSIYQQNMFYVGLTTIDSIFMDVFKIWASPGESRYSTVVCRLGHSLLVRTSVTINEVYILKCLLEFVSFTTFAP